MDKINVGDVFFAKINCFTYKYITDHRDLYNKGRGEEYKYPLLWNGDVSFLVNSADEILFCFKYIGEGKVIELSSGIEFNLESELMSDKTWYSTFYSEEEHVKNGELINRYNEETEEHDLISFEEYNEIFKQFIDEAENGIIRISLNEGNVIEVTEENKTKYRKVSDEERICLINYFTAVAKRKFKAALNKLYVNNNTLEDEAYFDNQLYDFEKKGRLK